MDGYSFIIAVIRREEDELYTKFFKKNGASIVFSTLCEGAAREKTLDMLGLERKEKLLLCCLVPTSKRSFILKHLRTELRIDAPNSGIALFMDLESIGGISALRFLCNNEIKGKDEIIKMSDNKYSLIVAIAEKGHTGDIMDAARKGGARGGTIIRAKGTQTAGTKKFFGVSLADEKELIYIVTATSQRDAIMSSIMKDAGINSPAHTVTFSLPVSAVAGITIADDEDEAE
ncbi:MAG: P-II family nitrogen regulator [Clostridia bacterium]|nr:P-II family nitrogen regulator [Clostridia bacterium]